MKKYIYIMLFLFFVITSPRVLAETYLIGTNPNNVSLFSSLDAEPVAPSVGVYSTDDREYAEQLLAEGKIAYIEKAASVELFSFEQDPLFMRQWNLQTCGFPKARSYTRGTNDVLVGVIDSGAEPNHPDFGDNILPGYSTAENAANPTDAADTLGHGTAVAGIIGALAYNGEGTAGIADNVRILPVQYTKSGNISTEAPFLAAIEYALNQGCDIINISAGTPAYTASLKRLMDRAYAENVIVVSAVGNSGTGDYNYPAAFNTVVGVGSTDKNNIVTNFSQKNTSVNVCAPGLDITAPISYEYSKLLVTQISSGYGYGNGTSFSCPQVAAAAALARSIKPDLTPDEFLSLISETSTDLGEAGYDISYGYGLLNIEAILNKLNPELSETCVVTHNIKKDGLNTVITITNNTAIPAKGKSITAFFSSEDIFADSPKTEYIEISPKNTSDITHITPDCSYAQGFLWSDFDNMKPLLKATQKILCK